MPTFNSDRRAILSRGLKSARQKARLSSREAIAMLSANGLSYRRSTLLAWEHHGDSSREPFASDLPILAIIYNCSVEDLFAESSGSYADQEE